MANFIPHNRTTVDGPITTTPRPQQTTLPAPSLSAPVATVEGGPSTSFGLPIGTAARFSDQDGTWSVALLGVAKIDRCEDLLGDPVPAIAFYLAYEVTEGAVSIVPLNDFTFVPTSGSRARPGLLSTCAVPALDYGIVSKGNTSRGWIVIPLTPGTQASSGTLEYGQLGTPTASWQWQT